MSKVTDIPKNYKPDTFRDYIQLDGSLQAIINMFTDIQLEALSEGWINLEVEVEQDWDSPDNFRVIGHRPMTEQEIAREARFRKKKAEQNRIAKEKKEQQERAELERLRKKYGT